MSLASIPGLDLKTRGEESIRQQRPLCASKTTTSGHILALTTVCSFNLPTTLCIGIIDPRGIGEETVAQ